MACETTYQIYQSLLTGAIDSDTSLTASMRASLKARVAAMPRKEDHVMGVGQVESTAGSITSDPVQGSVEVAIGVLGTNRVEFAVVAFATPVRIQGSDGSIGLLVGHVGESVNPAVATDEITVQYRLSSTDTWKAWSRTTLIPSTKSVQFAVDVADQISASALPQLWFLAEQL